MCVGTVSLSLLKPGQVNQTAVGLTSAQLQCLTKPGWKDMKQNTFIYISAVFVMWMVIGSR